MAQQYVLGIDHGTGGCKVTCINSNGKRVSEAYVPYPSYYSQPRWVEQDPEQWIEAAIMAVNEALKNFTQHDRKNILGMAFSAPHHVAVLLDKNKNIIRKAIMWNDQRSGKEAGELIEGYGEKIVELTKHRPTPTWTLPQLLWLKKNEPEAYEKIDTIMFEKDYIRYRFSGEIATDYIEAEGSMFFDVENQEWSEFLLSLLSIDSSVLPNVHKPTDQAGSLTKEMAEKMNLPHGIPVIIGTADTAAEIYGSGAVDEGDGVIKLATAGNFSILSSKHHSNLNLTGYHFPVEGLFYLNSATNFAAASFRWFKEKFYKEWEAKYSQDEIYPAIDQNIEQISPGSEGILFHPYLNGERSPYWPYLRGSFFGLTAGHSRAHFARSVLEGVAFSIRDASLEFDSLSTKNVKLIGGGSKSKIWSQIMADVLNVELEVPKISDSSYGTALIAATALGLFSNLKEAGQSNQEIVHKVSPNKHNVDLYTELFGLYKELYQNTKSISHQLTAIYEKQ